MTFIVSLVLGPAQKCGQKEANATWQAAGTSNPPAETSNNNHRCALVEALDPRRYESTLPKRLAAGRVLGYFLCIEASNTEADGPFLHVND